MRLLTTLTLIGVSYAVLTRVNKVHTGRRHARPAAKPHEVQTWEGEGGGLPTGGPGAGVKVAPATQPDPDLAHGGIGSSR
ncbi:MAG: hypothetical protein ABW032_03830 [Burkholderiaceae bacterium]